MSRSTVYDDLIQSGNYFEALRLSPLVLDEFVKQFNLVLQSYQFRPEQAAEIEKTMAQFSETLTSLNQVVEGSEFSGLLTACLTPARQEQQRVAAELCNLRNVGTELRYQYQRIQELNQLLSREQAEMDSLTRQFTLATKEHDALTTAVTQAKEWQQQLQKVGLPLALDQVQLLQEQLHTYLDGISRLSKGLLQNLPEATVHIQNQVLDSEAKLKQALQSYVEVKQRLGAIDEDYQKRAGELNVYLETQKRLVQAVEGLPTEDIGRELQDIQTKLYQIDHLVRAAVEQKQQTLQTLRSRRELS